MSSPLPLSAHRLGGGQVGVFLDPPYATSTDVYASWTLGISEQVRQWCLTAPPEYRIVLAGYDDEHDELLAHGWRKTADRAGSGSGYSKRSDNGRREQLWLSPACLETGQGSLI